MVTEARHDPHPGLTRGRNVLAQQRGVAAQIAALLAADNPAPAVPGASMTEIERHAIIETLRMTDGNVARAAEVLGYSARTLQYRLAAWRGSPPAW